MINFTLIVIKGGFMTFRQMELFIEVCDCESINKASEKNFISQQGVSRTIREMEVELNCSLLTRSKSGVVPTIRGNYFLKECRAMLEKKDFLIENLCKMEENPIEIISLGMSFGMISAIPYGFMKTFEENNPNTQISYSDHMDLNLEELLIKGRYDFCIIPGILDRNIISLEKITYEKVYLGIPTTHPLYNEKEITMENIKNQAFAMFSPLFHIRHDFERICQNHGFKPDIAISSSDFNSIKEIAINENLLCIVPEHTFIPQNNSIRYHPFPDDNFHWCIYLAKKNNVILSDNAELFYQYIKHLFLE